MSELATEPAPAVASRRQYLREQLPGVLREDPEGVGLSYLAALETVLDPITAILDGLSAYVDPQLAPADALDLVAAWLGEEVDESWPIDRRRALVAEAVPLAGVRGTKAGLERALELAFPDLPLRVEDGGCVRIASRGGGGRIRGEAKVLVYCDTPLEEPAARSLRQAIERLVPVHVRFELHVLERRHDEGDN